MASGPIGRNVLIITLGMQQIKGSARYLQKTTASVEYDGFVTMPFLFQHSSSQQDNIYGRQCMISYQNYGQMNHCISKLWTNSSLHIKVMDNWIIGTIIGTSSLFESSWCLSRSRSPSCRDRLSCRFGLVYFRKRSQRWRGKCATWKEEGSRKGTFGTEKKESLLYESYLEWV